MEFYEPSKPDVNTPTPQITNEEVERIFNEYFSTQKVEEKPVEKKPQPTFKFWDVLWEFLLCIIKALIFVIIKPVQCLAEKLDNLIKSKIIRYAVASLCYAGVILIIIL